jgi:hypothetical protein
MQHRALPGLTGFYVYGRTEVPHSAPIAEAAKSPRIKGNRMYRRDGGRPIREAIKRAGLSIPRLARRTKEIDPEGRGLSQAFIGFYTSTGSSGREPISTRAAGLMAAGVDSPTEELFTDQPDPPPLQPS